MITLRCPMRNDPEKHIANEEDYSFDVVFSATFRVTPGEPVAEIRDDERELELDLLIGPEKVTCDCGYTNSAVFFMPDSGHMEVPTT